MDDYWLKLALDIVAGEEYDLAWVHSFTLEDLVSPKGLYFTGPEKSAAVFKEEFLA